MNLYDPRAGCSTTVASKNSPAAQRISLRTGCFCNPGAGEAAEGLTDEEMAIAARDANMTLSRFVQLMAEQGTGKSAGAIRASVALVSNAADVERYLAFIASLRDQTRLTIGAVTFDIESCRVIRDGS